MDKIFVLFRDSFVALFKILWRDICSVFNHFLFFLEEKVLFRKKGEDVRTAKSDAKAAILSAGPRSEMFQVLRDINADKGHYVLISFGAAILYCIFVVILSCLGFGYIGVIIIPSIFVQVMFHDIMRATWNSLNAYLAHADSGNANDTVSVKLFSDILYYYDKARVAVYYHLFSVIGLFIIALVIGVILQ